MTPADPIHIAETRAVPVELLRRAVWLINQCDWGAVCGEVSELVETFTAHIEAEA